MSLLRNFRTLLQCCMVIVIAGMLVACNTVSYQQDAAPEEEPEAAVVEESAQSQVPIPEAEPKQEPENLQSQLLQLAEEAFRRGWLTEPAQDNAYDRFHAVLIIEPSNVQARAGMQAIMISYADSVRSLMATSKYSLARQRLLEAQYYFPDSALLENLARELKTLAPPPPVAAKNGDEKLKYEELPLAAGALSKRSQAIINRLENIGLRVKETNESVMIYARNDAEGRWIYKQLKQGAQGYRVRGDIRYAKQPKIRIMPPLD